MPSSACKKNRAPTHPLQGPYLQSISDSSRDECGLAELRIFFFNDTATTEIYTLSLHDALPIFARRIPELIFGDGAAVGIAHREQARCRQGRVGGLGQVRR